MGGLVGAVVFMNDKTPEDASNPTNTEESTSIAGTFKDLLQNGTSYQCTFSHSGEMGDTSGEVFIAKENMVRGSYRVEDTQGNVFDVEVMQDGEFNYVWGTSPFGDTALKTKITDTQNMSGDTSSADNTNFLESEEEVDFECKPWRVDNSKFTAPSDIEFNTFEIPTFNPADGAPTGIETTDICRSCDSAPAGAAREQCLQAISSFGCAE